MMQTNAPMSGTMADWWNVLPQPQRTEILVKRSISQECAALSWEKLGARIQGILNDQWWWNFTGGQRPEVADGPISETPSIVGTSLCYSKPRPNHIGPPGGGVPYAGGQLLAFSFEEVEKWGKWYQYGDARHLTVCRLKNGTEVLVTASEQDPKAKKLIDRITRRLNNEFAKRTRAGERLTYPNRDCSFVIRYGEAREND